MHPRPGLHLPGPHRHLDLANHQSEIEVDLLIPKPQHAPPLRFEASLTSRVPPSLSGGVVDRPIQLDDEARERAEEVHDHVPQLMLASKPRAMQRLSTKRAPEHPLGVGAIATLTAID